MTLLCGRGMVLKACHFMVKAYCFIDDDVFSGLDNQTTWYVAVSPFDDYLIDKSSTLLNEYQHKLTLNLLGLYSPPLAA